MKVLSTVFLFYVLKARWTPNRFSATECIDSSKQNKIMVCFCPSSVPQNLSNFSVTSNNNNSAISYCFMVPKVVNKGNFNIFYLILLLYLFLQQWNTDYIVDGDLLH